jgi:hypothetical protein
MSYTAIDFTLNGKLVYTVAATSHVLDGNLYLLYNAASDLQPVAIVPVATGLKLVESTVPAPPLPPAPPLSDATPWWLFNAGTPYAAARAFGIDATSQPGTILLSRQIVPPATGGVTVAIFPEASAIAIFREPFLLLPKPPITMELLHHHDV